jgi:His/Glu/Gln/Arg/opine family amino acid ABC transporter permease subunit
MLDPLPVLDNLRALLLGAVVTLELSLFAILLSVVLGVGGGLVRTWPSRGPRAAARVIVDVIRGTPLLVQMYVLYYGLPSLGLRLDAFPCAVIALGVNSGAYIAEIVRAALEAIPRAQVETARAIGMTHALAVRRVIIPQALGIALPPVSGEFIDIVKWSSVASIVVVPEITQVVHTIVGRTFTGFVELFLFVAAFYLAVTSGMAAASRRLELRVNRYRLSSTHA